MAEVRFSENALQDMGSIAAYIARDSDLHAAKQVERFFESAERSRPIRAWDAWSRKLVILTIRELIVGNYRMVYHLSEEELAEVLTVHHSARRFPFARVLSKITRTRRRR